MLNESLTGMLYRLPALLVALVFHEYAHAKVADYLGDPTPRYYGRLTLNPLNHLDPLGMLMFWLFRFGWAKPVPINPRYFRGDKRRGTVLVSLAGPAANLVIAFVSLILFKLLAPYFLSDIVVYHLLGIIQMIFIFNVFLAVFNMIPIPPLDGSKVLAGLLPAGQAYAFQRLEQYGPLLLMLLILTRATGYILIPMANIVISVLDAIVELLI